MSATLALSAIDTALDRLHQLARSHPMLGMAVLELECNIAAVMIMPEVGIQRKAYLIDLGDIPFESRIEALAYCFALTAQHLNRLLSANVAKSILPAVNNIFRTAAKALS